MAIAERIKQARLINGLTVRTLAAKVGVSPTAISKYELGKDVPSSGVLLHLARALGVRIEYLVRPTKVSMVQPCYRKRARLPSKQKKAIEATVLDWVERYLEIEELRNAGAKASGLHEKPSYEVAAPPDAEKAAGELRKAWNLGTDPIENLTELLEDKGVKVGVVEADRDFDACTFWIEAGGRVPVIVTRKGVEGDRQRFDLAHELGHLLLKPRPGLDMESISNRFAGAFLVPADAARLELGARRRNLSLYELHMLKHKYGLSMQAWVYRARDLDIIEQSRLVAIFRYFGQQGWRKSEPGDSCPAENPGRFQRLVLQALTDGLISESKASELLGKPLKQFYAEVAQQHGELPVGATIRL
jgi:Zn-dependent peptidase ImmA (M78 family)/DNA-binding XRE family transcriptional regulator